MKNMRITSERENGMVSGRGVRNSTGRGLNVGQAGYGCGASCACQGRRACSKLYRVTHESKAHTPTHSSGPID